MTWKRRIVELERIVSQRAEAARRQGRVEMATLSPGERVRRITDLLRAVYTRAKKSWPESWAGMVEQAERDPVLALAVLGRLRTLRQASVSSEQGPNQLRELANRIRERQRPFMGNGT